MIRVGNVVRRRCALGLAAVLVGLGGGGVASAQREPVQKWSLLLIIKPETRVPADKFGGCVGSMTQADIKAAEGAFRYAGDWVYNLSGKRVAWDLDVRVSDIPLTSVSAIGDGKECYPAPVDVQRDLVKYAPAGKYDGVFIYWKSKGSRDLPQPHNWGRGPTKESLNMGYATIGSFAASSLTKDSMETETFVHEWLHQVEQFYQTKGVKLPKDQGIHAATDCGYAPDSVGVWKTWYRAFMAGEIKDNPGTGLGPRAWSLGTMRQEAVKSNLIANSDLSSGSSGWRFESWRNGGKPTNEMIDRSRTTPDGKPSFYLKNRTDGDDARWMQTVRVKPNTTYVLGGYVQTRNVSKMEQSGKYGANISVLGTYGEVTETELFNVGSWRYVSAVFNSGTRTSVDVCLRNGFYGSTVTGEAWFAQPSLIEVEAPGGMTGGKYKLLSTGGAVATGSGFIGCMPGK